MSHMDQYEQMNSSIASLSLDDLYEEETVYSEESIVEPKLSGIIRGVFVSYGMRSMTIPLDVDDNLEEVKRTVEAKTGIPADKQILTFENSGDLMDGHKSLRSYGYMGGVFCSLSKAC